MNQEKLLLIYNPKSGQQNINRVLGDIALSLQEKWDIVIRSTLEKGHAEQIAFAEGGEYSVVVAAGGDGTVHEVVNGLMRLPKKPILGILPAGTANDVARTMQIPLDLLEACEFMKCEVPHAIDIGTCNGRYFVNFLGVGLISTVSDEMKQETKAYLGHFSYYIKSLQYVQSNELFHVTVTIGEKVIQEEAVMVYVGNGQSLAGLSLFADNEMDSGQFQVFIVKHVGLSQLFSLAASYFRGEPIQHEAIIRIETDSLLLECSPPQTMDTDGEKIGMTPVQVGMHRAALQVIGKI
jgi:diacylglycerol kinase (ATP)